MTLYSTTTARDEVDVSTWDVEPVCSPFCFLPPVRPHMSPLRIEPLVFAYTYTDADSVQVRLPSCGPTISVTSPASIRRPKCSTPQTRTCPRRYLTGSTMSSRLPKSCRSSPTIPSTWSPPVRTHLYRRPPNYLSIVSCAPTAQACHWFEYPKVWDEVSRVLKPQGTVAFWVRAGT